MPSGTYSQNHIQESSDVRERIAPNKLWLCAPADSERRFGSAVIVPSPDMIIPGLKQCRKPAQGGSGELALGTLSDRQMRPGSAIYDSWPFFMGHSALLGPVSNQVAFMLGDLLVAGPPSKSPVGNSHLLAGAQCSRLHFCCAV